VGWFDQTLDAAFSSFTLKPQIEHLRENVQKLEQRVSQLEVKIESLTDRTGTIENFRDADKAQLKAEIAEFKFEVERIMQRLLPPAP